MYVKEIWKLEAFVFSYSSFYREPIHVIPKSLISVIFHTYTFSVNVCGYTLPNQLYLPFYWPYLSDYNTSYILKVIVVITCFQVRLNKVVLQCGNILIESRESIEELYQSSRPRLIRVYYSTELSYVYIVASYSIMLSHRWYTWLVF